MQQDTADQFYQHSNGSTFRILARLEYMCTEDSPYQGKQSTNQNAVECNPLLIQPQPSRVAQYLWWCWAPIVKYDDKWNKSFPNLQRPISLASVCLSRIPHQPMDQCFMCAGHTWDWNQLNFGRVPYIAGTLHTMGQDTASVFDGKHFSEICQASELAMFLLWRDRIFPKVSAHNTSWRA